MDPDPPQPRPPHPAGLTARFAALVKPGSAPLPFDELCTIVAAHFAVGADADGTDLVAVRAGLDDLAKGVSADTVEGVVAHLADLGLGGDPSDYASPAASLLPDVVRRRRGLPILLAVVTVEVGRRVGVEAHVVGMPGHVLVSDGTLPPAQLADPFHRRPHVTPADAQALYLKVHGDGVPWEDRHLRPIGPRAVVARILANLANRYRADSRHRDEAVALGLRTLVPGVPVAEKGTLAAALARSGAFDRAADELEALAEAGGAGMEPDALRGKADRWRARLN
ncbi:MAG TPA: transglutaminase-like domain-containing protein [Iamia sp.]|nr:transglutaminase-like domain-containing protein [Iamia sp.]